MTDVAPEDHRHHRGVFLAWGEMHGKKDVDFWGWGEHAPTKDGAITHVSASDLLGGTTAGFGAENEWRAEGERIVAERLRASAKALHNLNLLDLEYTINIDAETKLTRSGATKRHMFWSQPKPWAKSMGRLPWPDRTTLFLESALILNCCINATGRPHS